MVGLFGCLLISSLANCKSASVAHVSSALRELVCLSFVNKRGQAMGLTSTLGLVAVGPHCSKNPKLLADGHLIDCVDLLKRFNRHGQLLVEEQCPNCRTAWLLMGCIRSELVFVPESVAALWDYGQPIVFITILSDASNHLEK